MVKLWPDSPAKVPVVPRLAVIESDVVAAGVAVAAAAEES